MVIIQHWADYSSRHIIHQGFFSLIPKKQAPAYLRQQSDERNKKFSATFYHSDQVNEDQQVRYETYAPCQKTQHTSKEAETPVCYTAHPLPEWRMLTLPLNLVTSAAPLKWWAVWRTYSFRCRCHQGACSDWFPPKLRDSQTWAIWRLVTRLHKKLLGSMKHASCTSLFILTVFSTIYT